MSIDNDNDEGEKSPSGLLPSPKIASFATISHKGVCRASCHLPHFNMFLRLIVDMVKTPSQLHIFLVLVEYLVSFHVMDSIENMQGFMGFMGSLTATELKKTTSIPHDPPLNDLFCTMEPSEYK